MKDSKKKEMKTGDSVTIEAVVIETDKDSATVEIGDSGHRVTLTKDQADSVTVAK